MELDISHLTFWTPAVWISLSVTIVLLTGSIITLVKSEDGGGLELIGVLVALFTLLLGPIITFGAFGATGYENAKNQAMTAQLLSEYGNVEIDDDTFVASKEGKYVSGVLANLGDGRYLVVEN